MFAELADLLQLDMTQSQVVAVTEQPPAEASFLICHLINGALRAGAGVRVLALDKPASHYRHLCAKCGANVRQAEGDTTLRLVDGAEMVVRALRSGVGGALPAQAVFEELTACPEPAPPLVVVDGLSALLALGCPSAEALLLVHNLARWSRRRHGLLVTLLSPDAEDEGERRLAAAVAGRADLAVTVRGLSSGHCARGERRTGTPPAPHRCPPQTVQAGGQECESFCGWHFSSRAVIRDVRNNDWTEAAKCHSL